MSVYTDEPLTSLKDNKLKLLNWFRPIGSLVVILLIAGPINNDPTLPFQPDGNWKIFAESVTKINDIF